MIKDGGSKSLSDPENIMRALIGIVLFPFKVIGWIINLLKNRQQ